MAARDRARIEAALSSHVPMNMAHHLGRFATEGRKDTYSTVQCACQEPDAEFMTQEEYLTHLVEVLVEEGEAR